MLNWVECTETIEKYETEEKNTKRFVHLTDMIIDRTTAVQISYTGRLRWKIENEGFNTQKNQGYNLKHKFSRVSLIAAKNYYQCIQIAHIINQLLILDRKFQALLTGKITIKHLWKCMIGFLIHGKVDCNVLLKASKHKIQFRFS
ncbi:MAG: hypothetical protein DRI87_09415 [Bacteroidetes bacterium]|nr:MAG: hypothetical protein DRI87_09415 [Bacteroidota bacterium]